MDDSKDSKNGSDDLEVAAGGSLQSDDGADVDPPSDAPGEHEDASGFGFGSLLAARGIDPKAFEERFDLNALAKLTDDQLHALFHQMGMTPLEEAQAGFAGHEILAEGFHNDRMVSHSDADNPHHADGGLEHADHDGPDHQDRPHGDSSHADSAHNDASHADDHADAHIDSHKDGHLDEAFIDDTGGGHVDWKSDGHSDYHDDVKHPDGGHSDVHFDHTDAKNSHGDSHGDGHNDFHGDVHGDLHDDHTDRVAHNDDHADTGDHIDREHGDHTDDAKIEHYDYEGSHWDHLDDHMDHHCDFHEDHGDDHSDSGHNDVPHTDTHADRPPPI